MKLDNTANQIYIIALNEAKLRRHEYIIPEHFLYASLLFDKGKEILENSGADIKNILEDLSIFFENNMYCVDDAEPIESFELVSLFENAALHVESASKTVVTLGDLYVAFFSLNESYATYILTKNGLKKSALLKYISHGVVTKAENKNKEEALSEEDIQFLEKYTTDLTKKAENGELDPLVGREDVIDRTVQVLSRRIKNNPIHVGEPGVGKTSIVEGIAQLIANGNAPSVIANSKIYYLDIGNVLAGTKYRGDFEERFIKILDLIALEKNPIIYIDEIHSIIGAGAISGSTMDASSILKPYLLKSNIRIIGSTTYTEYKKYFEKDRALVRRFQKIDISEPSVSDCIKILNGIKDKYEAYHNVSYTAEAIKAACELSDKYISDKKLPDKAIDVIDEAGAFVRTKADNDKSPIKIDKKIIEEVIAKTTGIKIESVSFDETEKLKNLSQELKEEIFGQDKAIEIVVNAIKASRSGLNDSERPIANLLFVGPTGVGKTEIVKQLSKKLGIKMQRFDMSEYQEKHTVARLIGAPPGYVGYEEGGLLTDAINKTPYSIILLDEIEKAHSDIYNILLQVMDYGYLTDTTGKRADCRNIILIMTSNAGASDMNKRIIGFDDKVMRNDAIKNEVEKKFSPEFRNRLDEIVLFNPINDKISFDIAQKAVNRLKERVAKKDVKLSVSDDAISYLANKGVSEKFGAREINRIVEKEIKKVLVDEILFGKISDGGYARVTLKKEKLSFSFRKKTSKND